MHAETLWDVAQLVEQAIAVARRLIRARIVPGGMHGEARQPAGFPELASAAAQRIALIDDVEAVARGADESTRPTTRQARAILQTGALKSSGSGVSDRCERVRCAGSSPRRPPSPSLRRLGLRQEPGVLLRKRSPFLRGCFHQYSSPTRVRSTSLPRVPVGRGRPQCETRRTRFGAETPMIVVARAAPGRRGHRALRPSGIPARRGKDGVEQRYVAASHGRAPKMTVSPSDSAGSASSTPALFRR